jgi:hypothetical protein
MFSETFYIFSLGQRSFYTRRLSTPSTLFSLWMTLFILYKGFWALEVFNEASGTIVYNFFMVLEDVTDLMVHSLSDDIRIEGECWS